MTQATREVRFAVVLYGGTSLAIYMNGISQELLRMARGSSGEQDLDPVEKIYSDISRTLHPGTRTRFVIDIISGTSAGGINGVALAKALVLGSKNLNVLRKAWTDEANIDQLLNDRFVSRWRKTEAVLDGGLMYDVLYRTLADMGNAAEGEPLVDMVDLFVTATDLVGRKTPIQLTGESIDEPVHKTVFHFAYAADPENRAKALNNDFTSDAMLAFAARCTSSFPIAFAPMRLSDVPERILRSEDFARFFPGDDDYKTRVYADGGYLDTKPFSHAIDLIPFRPTRLPGQRKLLFIDPFPEGRGGTRKADAEREIDFVTNARLAATTLPRREVIRDDLRQIHTMNRRLERLGALHERWQTDRIQLKALGKLNEPKPTNIDELYLADLMKVPGYGEQYPLYHHLRVYGTADMLSNLVAGLAGIAPDSATAAYLRQIVRAWRDNTFAAYATAGLRSETAFLSDYDLDFRRRRLTHLRANVTNRLGEESSNAAAAWRLWQQIEVELVRLRQLANPTSSDRRALLGDVDLDAIITALMDDYPKFAVALDLPAKYGAAIEAYQKAPKQLDGALTAIGVTLRRHFDDSSRRIGAVLADPSLIELLTTYEGFHWHDVVTFPFLEGTAAEEHAEVQVFRVSPADSGLDARPDKLAGISYGAFGGFLSRDWREHDILWGRLDGAERIVAALIPDPTDKRRAVYTSKLQDAILTEEFGASGTSRREAMLRRLVAADRLKELKPIFEAAPPIANRDSFSKLYGKPLDPEAPQLARWASRAGRIFARMLDDLPDNGALAGLGRVARPVRTGSVLAARLTLFATPGGYPGLLAERALFLLLILGLMLVAISVFVESSVLAWLGLGVFLGAAALWTAIYIVGRILRGRSPLPSAARKTLVLIGLTLAAFGLWTVVGFGVELTYGHLEELP